MKIEAVIVRKCLCWYTIHVLVYAYESACMYIGMQIYIQAACKYSMCACYIMYSYVYVCKNTCRCNIAPIDHALSLNVLYNSKHNPILNWGLGKFANYMPSAPEGEKIVCPKWAVSSSFRDSSCSGTKKNPQKWHYYSSDRAHRPRMKEAGGNACAGIETGATLHRMVMIPLFMHNI